MRDCCNSGLEDKYYNTILLINLIHVEPKKVLSEAKRVLKDDRRLVVISFTKDGIDEESRKVMIERYAEVFWKTSTKWHNVTCKTILKAELALTLLIKHSFYMIVR